MNDILASLSSFCVSLYGQLLQAFSIDFALKSAIAYGLIIWLACVIWVIKDVTNRTTNLLVQVFGILLVIVFTPVFGLPIYLLIRPNTTLFEQYYEETSLDSLSQEASEEAEAEVGLRCLHCHGSIEKHHHFCPHCGTELLVSCVSCGKSVHESWTFCPDCGGDQRKKSAKKKPKKEEPKAGVETLPVEEIVLPETPAVEAEAQA